MRIFAISPSSLDSFTSCARKGYYSSILRKIPLEKERALDLGSAWHVILEAYYKLRMQNVPIGDCMLPAVEKLHEYYATESSLDAETLLFLGKVFSEYLDAYKDETWTPVSVEEPFSVLLHKDEDLEIRFEGKIDLEITTPALTQNLIVDHKSSSAARTPKALSNQFMGYAWAKGVNNVVINQANFAQNPRSERFRRFTMSYTDAQLQEWARWTTFHALRMDQLIQAGIFPPNFSSCWNCRYVEVCMSEEDNRPWRLETFFKMAKPHDLFAKESDE